MTSPLAPLDVAASASASVVASTATASASATPVLDSVSTFVNLASGFCRAGLKFWKPSQLVKLASQLISPQLREAFINDAPAEDPLSVSCADWGMTRLSQDSPFSNVIYVFEVLGPADELAKQIRAQRNKITGTESALRVWDDAADTLEARQPKNKKSSYKYTGLTADRPFYMRYGEHKNSDDSPVGVAMQIFDEANVTPHLAAALDDKSIIGLEVPDRPAGTIFGAELAVGAIVDSDGTVCGRACGLNRISTGLPGGQDGIKRSDETKTKMSEAQKGHEVTTETRLKQSMTNIRRGINWVSNGAVAARQAAGINWQTQGATAAAQKANTGRPRPDNAARNAAKFTGVPLPPQQVANATQGRKAAKQAKLAADPHAYDEANARRSAATQATKAAKKAAMTPEELAAQAKKNSERGKKAQATIRRKKRAAAAAGVAPVFKKAASKDEVEIVEPSSKKPKTE